MKLKEMKMTYSVSIVPSGSISFYMNRIWCFSEITWGKDCTFTRKRQAIAYAKWQCKAFNEAQKGKK